MALICLKCFNCGANLDYDIFFENFKCKYCGSIFIDDNYNNETNIKEYKKALKHFEIEEYNESRKILQKLTNDDKFFVSAFLLLLKNDLKLYEQDNFMLIDFDLANEIIQTMDRIQKISPNEMLKNLNEEIKIVDDIRNAYNEYKEYEDNEIFF